MRSSTVAYTVHVQRTIHPYIMHKMYSCACCFIKYTFLFLVNCISWRKSHAISFRTRALPRAPAHGGHTKRTNFITFLLRNAFHPAVVYQSTKWSPTVTLHATAAQRVACGQGAQFSCFSGRVVFVSFACIYDVIGSVQRLLCIKSRKTLNALLAVVSYTISNTTSCSSTRPGDGPIQPLPHSRARQGQQQRRFFIYLSAGFSVFLILLSTDKSPKSHHNHICAYIYIYHCRFSPLCCCACIPPLVLIIISPDELRI